MPKTVTPIFLSTLSLRRATTKISIKFPLNIDFYPRSPCGERLVHTLKLADAMLFLSTLSLRRATWPGLLARPFFIISIHALLAESDKTRRQPPSRNRDFYPRSPCGERHNINSSVNTADKISIHALLAESDHNVYRDFDASRQFLSTLSLRRATPRRLEIHQWPDISIHALLAESDSAPRFTPAASRNFYPRSPCGERLNCSRKGFAIL